MSTDVLKKKALLNGEFVDLFVYACRAGASFTYDYKYEQEMSDGTTNTVYVYPGSEPLLGDIDIEVLDVTFFCLKNDEDLFSKTNMFIVDEKSLLFLLPGKRFIRVYANSGNGLTQEYGIGNIPALRVISNNMTGKATGLLYRNVTVYHNLNKFMPPYTTKYEQELEQETGHSEFCFSPSGIFSPTIMLTSGHDGSEFIQYGQTERRLDFSLSPFDSHELEVCSKYGSYPMDFFTSISSEYRLSIHNGLPSIDLNDYTQSILRQAEESKIHKTEKFLERFWGYDEDFKFGLYADCGDGGNISFDKEEGYFGDLMSFTVTPDSHYVINSVRAYNAKTNAEITLQESLSNPQTGETTYSFTMPETNVRIIADFRFIGVVVPVIVKYTNEQGKLYTAPIHFTRDEQTQTGGNQS